MRKIEFSELKLKNDYSEEDFYNVYLHNIETSHKKDNLIEEPIKKYEVCQLNILGGKIIAIDKNYIDNPNTDLQELYYDYPIAKEIANHLSDIKDGIMAEQEEFVELYKDERLKKDELIKELQLKDSSIFEEQQKEYNILINSSLYSEYQKLLKENAELKNENKNLLLNEKHKGFFARLADKFRNKKLPISNGE